MNWPLSILPGLAAISLLACRHEPIQPPPPPVVHKICFQRQVLPIYVSYCSRVEGGCHDAGNPRIALTSYAGIMNGIRKGNPDGSWFFHVIGTGMAPWAEPQVNSAQLDTIRQWINEGAKDTLCDAISCDTNTTVRYVNDVQTIFSNYCDGCHGSTVYPTGIQFSNYDWAAGYIKSDPDRFKRSIRYAAGAGKNMPPVVPMNDCDRERLEAWINKGMPK